MMINNKLLAVLIGLLLVIVGISASVFIYYKNNAFETKGYSSWKSVVYGNVSINEPYYIIVPIPLNISKKPMYIANDFIIIEGNASFNYTKTKYGLGLWVESTGDFIIDVKYKARSLSQNFVYYSLSVENITKTMSFPQLDFYREHLFWVYGNFTSGNNSLSLQLETSGPANYCNIDTSYIGGTFKNGWQKGTIKNGWQKIDGEYTVNYYC